MKITDLDKSNIAIKALKENFSINFDTSGLSKAQTKTMLDKVNSLIQETKLNSNFYKNQTNSYYMKLVFMAQALTEHYLKQKTPKIIVENQEVEKSQVILAAQDMLDSLQKMIEEVNDMLVKELPALTDSIQSEIGVKQSSSFNDAASSALTSLNQCLSQSKSEMQNAMNLITGTGSLEALGSTSGGEEMAVTDVGMDVDTGSDEIDLDAEELSSEVPSEPDISGVGREKR